MNNVMRIDFTTGIANSDGKLINGTEVDVSVLWNITVISEEEVRKLIDSGWYECDERIVVTTPRQADNLRGK